MSLFLLRWRGGFGSRWGHLGADGGRYLGANEGIWEQVPVLPLSMVLSQSWALAMLGCAEQNYLNI